MTATGLQQAPQTGQSLITTMAVKYGLEPNKFYGTLEKTILPSGKNASPEQVAAFLVVANHYDLNPFIKEIYAFPNQTGGISPIVSVDGWLTLINRQPALDGIEYQDHLDTESGELTAITCRIYRKDRSRPNEITEYMRECKRGTSTWNTWPARMLRHKALIQCARQAFGLAGIYDPDEAERIASNENGNGHGNGTPIAEKTKAKVEELKQRYAPVDEPVTDEPEAIEGELVTDEPADFVDPTIHDIPPDEEPDAIEAEAEFSDLDKLRITVQTALEGLAKPAQKNVMAGRSYFVKDANEEQLREVLKTINEYQA